MAQPPGTLIDPQTWMLLAPEAFDADRGERRPLRRAGLALAGAVVLIALGIWSGLWTPALSSDGASSGTSDLGSTASAELRVRNERATAVTIEGAGTTDVPGVEIVRAHTDGSLPGLAEGTLHVDFRVVDCREVSVRDEVAFADRVTVNAQTWRGNVPVTVSGNMNVITSMATQMCQP